MSASYAAFPTSVADSDTFIEGMSRREYAAIAILQGMMASEHGGEVYRPVAAAKRAVQFADALYKELAS